MRLEYLDKYKTKALGGKSILYIFPDFYKIEREVDLSRVNILFMALNFLVHSIIILKASSII